MACLNGALPLQLPIRNVTFGGRGASSTRGIELGVGSPQQIISALPGLHDHDLPVWSSESCSQFVGTEAQCIAFSGGVYNPSESDTYSQVRLSEWNGTTDHAWFQGDWIFFNEQVSFGANNFIDNLPLFMTTERRNDQCVLPLAPNSTFLANAYGRGQIPSTAIGLYAGSTSIEAPDEGLLVIGGFDSTGFEGDLTDMVYNPECPGCFDVESIVYDSGENVTELLDEAMHVVYWLAADDLTLPLAAFDKLAQAAWLSTGEPEAASRSTPTFAGNLTVRLTNGFQVTIPHHELFHQQRNYSESGSLEILENTTSKVFVEGANGTSDWVYEWGMPFLSQVYLVYDYDRQTQKIGNAHRLDRRQSIEAGDFTERQIKTICPTDPAEPARKSSTGPIAGGAVGGVVFIILLMAVGLWLYLRRRRSRMSLKRHTPGSEHGRMLAIPFAHGSVSSGTDDSQPSPATPKSFSDFSEKHVELAHSPSTTKSIAELSEKHPELAHSTSTIRARAELPEKHLVEMASQEQWWWPHSAAVEMDVNDQRDLRGEIRDHKSGMSGPYELHMPTPTRATFRR